MASNASQPSAGMSADISMGEGSRNPIKLAPKISPTGFTAGIFSVLAISILTIIFRLILRLQRTKRLEIDDYFLILSLILLIAAAALQQYYRDGTYLVLNVELRNIPPSEEFFLFSPTEASVLDASSVLLWTSIFSIKFSFLFFFRKLINRVHVLRVYWWLVMGFVTPSALVCMFLGFLECPYFGPDFLQHCPVDRLVSREHVYLNTTVVLDIFTDVLIISLPIALLWNVKIPLVKKLTLLGMFGLSIVMIVIALIRVTEASLADGIIDTTWLFFWQIMEASIALIMVSVSAFRGLFGQSKQHPAYGSGAYRGQTPAPDASKSAKVVAKEVVVAQPRNLKGLISSPRSPKTLTALTPVRLQPDVAISGKDTLSSTSGSLPPSISGMAAIELQDVKPPSYQSRGQSRTRDYSPARSIGPNVAGFSDPHGTTSTHVWSDNDRRERSKERHSRWDAPSGASSRAASRSREALDRVTGKRSASREVPVHLDSNAANQGLSRVPSQGERLIMEREREARDHSRNRNLSSDTMHAVEGRGRMSPEQWV